MLIAGARERVRVQTPYFILEGSLAEALKNAALSGVDVSVMVAGRGPDQRLVYWAARTYLAARLTPTPPIPDVFDHESARSHLPHTSSDIALKGAVDTGKSPLSDLRDSFLPKMGGSAGARLVRMSKIWVCCDMSVWLPVSKSAGNRDRCSGILYTKGQRVFATWLCICTPDWLAALTA